MLAGRWFATEAFKGRSFCVVATPRLRFGLSVRANGWALQNRGQIVGPTGEDPYGLLPDLSRTGWGEIVVVD